MTKPPRRESAAQAEHIQSLKAENRRLEDLTHTGVNRIVHDIPELADLIHALSDLLFLAEVGKGRQLDASRGSGNALSADGRSTSQGRDSMSARSKVAYWRRRLAGQVEAIRNDLDPSSTPQEVRPRCHRRGCDGRGRRQPVGSKYCSFCREDLKGTDG